VVIGKNQYGQTYGKHTISEVGHIADPFFASGQICPFSLSFPSLFQNRGKFALNFSSLIYNNINIYKTLLFQAM
jgi:hypothetical protein